MVLPAPITVAARQAPLGLDAQIQLPLTIEASSPLVIPGLSLTAQLRDHLAEAPAGLARGQALQQTANLFIISPLASIAIGRRAAGEQLAGPSNRIPSLLNGQSRQRPPLGGPQSFFSTISCKPSLSIQTSAYIFCRRRCSSVSSCELAHHGDVHAAVLGPPFIKTGVAHPVFAAKLSNRYPCFGLLQDVKYLGLGKSRFLQRRASCSNLARKLY